MSKPIAWIIIAALGLNFGACALMSYLGTGVTAAAQTYPRVVKTSSGSSGAGLIRTGSIGGGASRSGGGPSSGK